MQFVQSGETTNKFLRTLLTTTPSASHISDFRQQRRTDSRADKPDTFPGFDLEDITLSPRKRRRQAYSQLIRGLLEKTRERLETIRDVVKEEKQLRFHLHPDENENESNAAVSIFEFTNPDANDDKSIRFTLSNDADDGVSHISPNPSAYTSSVPRKYFSSLLAAIGFNRIVPSSTIAPDTVPAKNQNAPTNDGNGIFATYLFNPVLDIWHLARKKFNFNLNERNDGDDATANTNDANDADDADSGELQLTIVYADDSETGSAGASNGTNDERNGNVNDNINQLPLLPLLSTESSYNSSDDDDSRMHNNSKRNAPASSVERAAQAFQNAFFKYSNYMRTTSPSPSPITSAHETPLPPPPATHGDGQMFGPAHKSTSMHNDVVVGGGSGGTDANGLLANFLDDSPSNIQIVPSGKSKMNEATATGTGTASTAADADDKRPSSKRQSLESAGILVLEMFGTVIGLTWGAFSHVQSYFNNNRNNETMT